jgi:hypothetical protein
MVLKRQKTCLLLVCFLASCAGYRGGWESVAYIGDTPPAALSEAALQDNVRNLPDLSVSGLKLRVTIDNQLRTYDTQVYLFAVPASIDPRHAYPKNHVPGMTRVYVDVTPQVPGFVFRPSAATLRVAGKQFAGAAGFEFGMWDDKWNRVAQGGRWEHRPIASDLVLSEVGRRYLLSIDFATPVPSPESRDIVLDLSHALASAAAPALPPIRFAPVRWKEGYT